MSNRCPIVAAGLRFTILALPGCIIVADTSTQSDSPSRRVHLSSDERANLPRLVSLADAPTVERRYATQLASLTPEMSVEAFKSKLPQATFVERRTVNGATVDAYSVKIDEKFRYRDRDYGYVAEDEQWFYFRDGKYVKYARPNQW
jgi:hypothetical protein